MPQVIDCPFNVHDGSCICRGTKKIVAQAAESDVQVACQMCGDKENGLRPCGNVGLDDVRGIYIPTQCPACGTYGRQDLVEQLNRERCPCQGLGHASVDPQRNIVTGEACPRCGAFPTDETLERVRRHLLESP